MATSPLVVIVGETASGKSGWAMHIARELDGEIISADSWSVYKDFDIGTAKPSAQEQESIKHHLLDVARPEDGFNAVLYKDLANKAIENIAGKGKLPIIAGGTGLYVDAVLYDFEFLPTSNERQAFNKMSIEDLLAVAKDRSIDLADIDLRNKRRVIRAIEANGAKPKKSQLRDNTIILGIKKDRQDLKERIAKRVQLMFDQGLEDEVHHLSSKLGWDNEAMKGIGYWQWREYFEGDQTLVETKHRIVQSTLGLAKRQRTWFRRNKNIQWCEDLEQANKLIKTFLNK